MSRSNCFFWAFRMYWRRRLKGKQGYIVARHSRWGNFPHVLYLERGRLVSYVPLDPRHKMCPPPLFKGRVRWGDI